MRGLGDRCSRHLRQLGGAVLFAVLVAITGCGGGSSSPAGQESSAPSAPTTAASSTPRPAPTVAAAASSTIHIDYTSHDGWHYAHTFPYPDFDGSFSKDISQAPPGQARLAVSMSGSPPPPRETGIPDDNPGRPGGPTLLMDEVTVYPITSPHEVVDTSSLGACSFVMTTPEGGRAKDKGWPYDNLVGCEPGLSGPVDGTTSEAVSEAAVDRLVSSLADTEPTYVVTVAADGQGLDTCAAWLLPSGKIGYSSNGCDGQFKLTVG